MIFDGQKVRKFSMILAVGFAFSVSILPGVGNKAVAETTPKKPVAGTAAEVPAPAKIPFPRPDSHKANWLEYHGASAGLSLFAGEQSCLTCHERNDCISCHNTRPPRDHTNTWRTLSHGFMAEGNRERCFTCHRQDFCVRCHNETAPRSHTAGWLGGANRHCTVCHFNGTVPGDGCGVCHKKPPH